MQVGFESCVNTVDLIIRVELKHLYCQQTAGVQNMSLSEQKVINMR